MVFEFNGVNKGQKERCGIWDLGLRIADLAKAKGRGHSAWRIEHRAERMAQSSE